MQRNDLSKKEILIILTVIVLLAAAAVIMYFMRDSGAAAVITVGDQTAARKKLSEDAVFEINGAVIEIDSGKVRVKSNDCPDKICVHTGFISKEGETIVCMPKKLIVAIEE